MRKYEKKYGVSEDLGKRRESVQHQYGDKYEEFKSKGILKERWHGENCYVTEHQVRMGTEEGTEEGVALKKQRKASQSDWKLVRETLRALKWNLDVKPSDESLEGDAIPQYIWDKVNTALDEISRKEKDSVTTSAKLPAGLAHLRVHTQPHTLHGYFTCTPHLVSLVLTCIYPPIRICVCLSVSVYRPPCLFVSVGVVAIVCVSLPVRGCVLVCPTVCRFACLSVLRCASLSLSPFCLTRWLGAFVIGCLRMSPPVWLVAWLSVCMHIYVFA